MKNNDELLRIFRINKVLSEIEQMKETPISYKNSLSVMEKEVKK
jgi:hypothetical protein